MNVRVVPTPPALTPIANSSPSLAAEMRRCMLGVAFGKSAPHRALVSRAPAARLGIACHSVLDAVSNGALDQVPVEEWSRSIGALWEQAAREQWADARRSQVDDRLGPPKTWPYYNLRLAQVEELGKELAEARCQNLRAATSSRAAGLTRAATQLDAGSELYVSGFGGKLRGRIDRVTNEVGGIRIDDYKTGAIYEHVDDPVQAASIKEDYRSQLLIYAALFHEQTGTWPGSARLIPLRGAPVTVSVEPETATAAAREAVDLLDRYNLMIGQRSDRDLASPSASACSSCDFRGPCPAYWGRVDTDWIPPDLPSCAGEVTMVRRFGDGTASLSILAREGSPHRGPVVVRGLSVDQIAGESGAVTEGSYVRLVRLRQHREAPDNELWGGPQTEIWISLHPTPSSISSD